MILRNSIIGIITVALVIVLGSRSIAQETPRLINTDAKLESVLILRMTPERYVEFEIMKINEDLYQVTDHPDDVMFSVESTGNWNLSISANNPYFIGENDESNIIPVDFLGLTIENTGSNWDNGLFSNIANATKDTILYLAHDKVSLLASGLRGNIGGSDQNSFILRWKFFYEDDMLRTMKFSEFDILDDKYKVGYTITLSESTNTGTNDF